MRKKVDVKRGFSTQRKILCTECSRPLVVSMSLAGQVKCPNCGQVIRVSRGGMKE